MHVAYRIACAVYACGGGMPRLHQKMVFPAIIQSSGPMGHSVQVLGVIQTWSNLADTLVKHAELLQEAGDAHSCTGAVYGQAMAAYAKACSLCSSEDGDDLPGLLHNWGVGLHSLGTHAQVSNSSCLLGQ